MLRGAACATRNSSAACQPSLLAAEDGGRLSGCHRVRSLRRVPWKQFLSELSLVLICGKVGMVTANHILGHFFAFVAMGICLLQLCLQ